jgi:hypothetical protein
MSKWEEYKKKLGETRPWDALNPSVPRVSEEIADSRYSLCLSCPELINLTKQCKQCGCFMAVKTKLMESTCPIGKW